MLRRYRYFILALLLVVFLHPRLAVAHGGSVSYDEDVGAYHLTVMTSQSPNSRDVLFSIYLTELENGGEIAGATVKMRTALPDGALQAEYVVPPDPATLAGYYDLRVPFAQAGSWRVDLDIDGGRGPASTTFSMSLVDPPAPQNSLPWALILPALALTVGALLLVFWMNAREAQTNRRRPRTRRT